ncbi:pentapeptide repeat-containing protein [Mycolicibacterium sp. OfavD-34-C]|uniref:pentapeptide repeat-containing protein n=1 Tax=Mycolicibacterium sp. OfavD-34-C TaxID=2917746 RepID=UPI001EF4008E|nr:pentapeptide repeat-containing protein [Mycolicibacterium sp. OfavD-34-C]MCG7579384.1 pentapeptide repeat-containing protein [Mycolicibacterium sp. OfavD-34-C]
MNLSDLQLNGAQFVQADLRGAEMYSISLRSVSVNEIETIRDDQLKLLPGSLDGKTPSEAAKMALKVLREAGGTGIGYDPGATKGTANLAGAKLCQAKLKGADLTDANLAYASLRDVDLTRTEMDGANLLHADLKGALLNLEKLVDVYWDDTTRWPDNFHDRPGRRTLEGSQKRSFEIMIENYGIVDTASC